MSNKPEWWPKNPYSAKNGSAFSEAVWDEAAEQIWGAMIEHWAKQTKILREGLGSQRE